VARLCGGVCCRALAEAKAGGERAAAEARAAGERAAAEAKTAALMELAAQRAERDKVRLRGWLLCGWRGARVLWRQHGMWGPALARCMEGAVLLGVLRCGDGVGDGGDACGTLLLVASAW
jgi:hypothetical protein